MKKKQGYEDTRIQIKETRRQGDKAQRNKNHCFFLVSSYPRILVSLILVSLFFVAPSAHGYAFYRDLKVGDTGEDVRELQRTLNQLPGTRVSEIGPGSQGQETSYFGEKTRSAVIRYQELYARDILSPLGLSAGTGFVGASTRSKLSVGTGLASPSVGAGQSATPAAAPHIGAPSISSVMPSHGVAGTEVTLRGSGFSATGNTVLTPFGTIGNLPSSDGTTITFTVREPFPDDIDFPDFLRQQWKSMQYGFVVENGNGRSGQALFTLDLF